MIKLILILIAQELSNFTERTFSHMTDTEIDNYQLEKDLDAWQDEYIMNANETDHLTIPEAREVYNWLNRAEKRMKKIRKLKKKVYEGR